MSRHILVAGTFDYIHKGHEKILETALGSGEEITIGLTSDSYISSYKQGTASSFEDRKARLEEWLVGKSHGKSVVVSPIDDPYGPAVTGQYDAIVVSTQTRGRADEINEKRKSQGRSSLSVIEVAMVLADDGESVSSTRVREGVIDTNGRLHMPDHMRDELVHPVGTLLVSDEDINTSFQKTKGHVIASVGDITTTKLMNAGITPSLAIVDLMVQRKPFRTFDEYGFSRETRIIRVLSGPGFIADTAVEAISDWITDLSSGRSHPYAIIVTGEEDLLVLPVIRFAPLGTVVYYGQPELGGNKEGLVMVEVTEVLQKRIEEILSRFTPVKEEQHG